MNKTQVISFCICSIVVLILCVLVQPVCAKEARWYIGAGVGATEIESDIVLYTILNPQYLNFKERDTGFKVFAGYRVNDFFSCELSYIDFGKIEVLANSGGVIKSEGVLWEFTQDGSHLEVDYTSIDLNGTLSFPLKKITSRKILNRLTPYGRLGVNFWSVDKALSAGSVNYYQTLSIITGLPANPTTHSIKDETGFGWCYGIGITCAVAENFSLTLGWEWSEVGSDMITDSDFIFLSASCSF